MWICLQSAKAGRVTAIFTAECSYTFHFPCVASYADDRNHVCGASWRDTSLLPLSLSSPLHELDTQKIPKIRIRIRLRIRESKNNKSLRVYNADEPLFSSPISPAGFNTIPELDENDYGDEEENDNGDFKGFFVNTPSPLPAKKYLTGSISGHVDIKRSSDAAIVAVGRGNETYSVLMKIKSPPLPATRRSPVDYKGRVYALSNIYLLFIGLITELRRGRRRKIEIFCRSDWLREMTIGAALESVSILRKPYQMQKNQMKCFSEPLESTSEITMEKN